MRRRARCSCEDGEFAVALRELAAPRPGVAGAMRGFKRFQAVSSAAMPVLARGALCPLPLADAA